MLIEGFYQIVEFESTDHMIVASLILNNDHDVYKGHFPGQPVVPGVIQLQLIKEMVEKATKQDLILSEASSVKYLSMIDPNVTGKLMVEIKYSQVSEDQYKVNASIKAGELVFTKLRGSLTHK